MNKNTLIRKSGGDHELVWYWNIPGVMNYYHLVGYGTLEECQKAEALFAAGRENAAYDMLEPREE